MFSLGALPENSAFSSAVTVPNVIQLTNASRLQFAEQPLAENQMLDAAAQAKAEDMIKNQYFAHVSPNGKQAWDFIRGAGYSYIIAGENLAINFYSSEGLDQAWMSSPGHRANILNKDYEDIGIGIAQGNYYGQAAIFVVQMFGTKTDQPILVQDTYTKLIGPSVPAGSSGAVAPEIVSAKATPVSVGGHLGYAIDATVHGNASVLLATVGSMTTRLQPTAVSNEWSGTLVPAGENSQLQSGNLTVTASDMNGNTSVVPVAGLTSGTLDTYGFTATPQQSVQIFGKTLSLDTVNEFYLLFIVAVLLILSLAIAINRHVQKVPMISHAAGVIMFALVLWLV